jgi:hypothetical protein
MKDFKIIIPQYQSVINVCETNEFEVGTNVGRLSQTLPHGYQLTSLFSTQFSLCENTTQ